MAQYEKTRTAKIKSKLGALEQKQRKEASALWEKFKNQRDEITKQRGKELEILEKRYSNIKKDLEQRYKLVHSKKKEKKHGSSHISPKK